MTLQEYLIYLDQTHPGRKHTADVLCKADNYYGSTIVAVLDDALVFKEDPGLDDVRFVRWEQVESVLIEYEDENASEEDAH